MGNTERFNRIRAYVYQLMSEQLDEKLVYHSIGHTFDDVLPAAERIAQLEAIDDASLVLVRTAAVLHDLGFIEQRDGHEEDSIQIAQSILPTYDYRSDEIALICGMIAATRIPQQPQTLLEKIIADADLDVLGRHDFPERNQALRDELTVFGTPFSDKAWFEGQLRFVTGHQYFTGIQQVHKQQKAKNIAWLATQLQKTT